MTIWRAHDLPGQWPGREGLGWTTAVVMDVGADASATEDEDTITRLNEMAVVIGGLSGVQTVPLLVSCPDSYELMQMLHGLPVQVGAVYLAGNNPERLREAQALLADVSARPVITEADAEAISLVGAVLTYLGGRDLLPADSRVVVAGKARLPTLCPLLLTAGLFQHTRWAPADAPAAPLSRATRDADVVIDLTGGSEQMTRLQWDRPCDSVIASPPNAGLLPVPGLMRAIAAAVGPLVDIETYHACAAGLMRAAPPRSLSPRVTSPDLVGEVEAAAARVLAPAASSPLRRDRRPNWASLLGGSRTDPPRPS
ncbi:hypothetical protein [Pseudonocardia parietis]|uniref:Uncharacterized protein n=1 Tax=Pseudonocardia parietis TaxID=570936 RepID=A0ABS4VLU5_9PSEU|nr:hypothetical protein [Pseudonocardia parietis]MBP2364895.1 hypothetical protein [Pseudonocardia parietis]